MRTRGDIKTFLELMARYAELIEACYHDGSIYLTDENEGAIRHLRNARVLSVREKGQFGLTRAMREMLDENMQRQRAFAIGGNIGDEIARMEKLLFELEEAANQGKQEEIKAYTADLNQSLYDIADVITGDLLQFDQVMSTKFSDVRTNEEKMRQNTHFLDRAKRLQESLEQINRSELHERFNSPLTGDAGRVYRSAISKRITEWSASLLANSQVFEQFMFTFRSIAEDTRRMRAFTRFLKEGGSSKLADTIEDNHEHCPALMRVYPEPVEFTPDVFSDRGRDIIATIVADLKPLESRKVETRKPGTRLDTNTPISIEEDMAPEDRALSDFLSFVKESGAGWNSAGKWAERNVEVSRAEFLEHILSWSDLDRDEEEFDIHFIEEQPDRRRSANMAIGDIALCRAT